MNTKCQLKRMILYIASLLFLLNLAVSAVSADTPVIENSYSPDIAAPADTAESNTVPADAPVIENSNPPDIAAPADTGETQNNAAPAEVKTVDNTGNAETKAQEATKPAAKKSSVKVTVGTWDECNRGKNHAGDYTFSYYQIAVDDLIARVDLYNLDRTRYWLNYGKLNVVNDPAIKIAYLPGLQLNNVRVGKTWQEQFFYGGHLAVSIPKLGISILQKSYAGSTIDFHQTFADLKIFKNMDVSWYNFMNAKVNPDAYLGPKLKLDIGKQGNIFVWYGWSTNKDRPDARLLNIGGSIKF